MDTKKLRQKLLDLAIRGKLVPQDPNDEPASELLSRIHAEKLTMVERGELKPKDVKNDTVIYFGSDGLPYEKRADDKGEAKCIEEEIPFEIPEGWSWARLQSLSRVITDGDHQAPPQTASGIPFLVISNIANGVICFDDTRFVPRTYFDEIKRQRVPQRGDLLLSVTGSYGIPAVVNTDRDFCFQRHIALIKPFLSANFLSRVVSSSYCSKWFDKKATGTAQKTVALSILRSTLIPVPPLVEQRRIVDALDKYLALVNRIERNWVDLDGLLAQLKPKVLDLAIRGRLTERDPADEPASELLKRIHAEKLAMVGRGELKPKDVKVDTVIFTGSDGLRYEKPADGKGEPRCVEDEIPFELPEGWAWARFSNIVRKIGSKDNQVKTKGLLKNGDYPVISQSASSYVDGYYSGTIQPITSVPVLLFGDHTRTVKYINQPFVIGADGTKCHNAIGINPVFLFHAMQVAAERIENRGYGRHYALLERYLLAIPPLAEQRRINSAIEAIISATNL
jgi:type I restriction enzyme S subunit